MVNQKIVQKILEFLNEKHFSGQPMHYFTVDEIVKGAKLKKMNINEITGTMLYLYNKGNVKGMREMGVAHPTSIYITEAGIEKLDSFKVKPKKPITSNSKFSTLQKIGIFATVVIVPLTIFSILLAGGVIDPLLFFCQTGVNDRTYTDCDLGFQISSPNDRWYFDTDLAQIKEDRSGTPPEKYYLGGIYLATTDLDHVLIAVFDDDRLKEQSIEEWINNFKVIAEKKYNATTIKHEISTDGDWGIYSGEFFDEDGRGYIEQILEIENGKVYFRQKAGLHPEIMLEEQKKDFEFILNSYSKFQTIYQIIFLS